MGTVQVLIFGGDEFTFFKTAVGAVALSYYLLSGVEAKCTLTTTLLLQSLQRLTSVGVFRRTDFSVM